MKNHQYKGVLKQTFACVGEVRRRSARLPVTVSPAHTIPLLSVRERTSSYRLFSRRRFSRFSYIDNDDTTVKQHNLHFPGKKAAVLETPRIRADLSTNLYNVQDHVLLRAFRWRRYI